MQFEIDENSLNHLFLPFTDIFMLSCWLSYSTHVKSDACLHQMMEEKQPSKRGSVGKQVRLIRRVNNWPYFQFTAIIRIFWVLTIHCLEKPTNGLINSHTFVCLYVLTKLHELAKKLIFISQIVEFSSKNMNYIN